MRSPSSNNLIRYRSCVRPTPLHGRAPSVRIPIVAAMRSAIQMVVPPHRAARLPRSLAASLQSPRPLELLEYAQAHPLHCHGMTMGPCQGGYCSVWLHFVVYPTPEISCPSSFTACPSATTTPRQSSADGPAARPNAVILHGSSLYDNKTRKPLPPVRSRSNLPVLTSQPLQRRSSNPSPSTLTSQRLPRDDSS